MPHSANAEKLSYAVFSITVHYVTDKAVRVSLNDKRINPNKRTVWLPRITLSIVTDSAIEVPHHAIDDRVIEDARIATWKARELGWMD